MLKYVLKILCTTQELMLGSKYKLRWRMSHIFQLKFLQNLEPDIGYYFRLYLVKLKICFLFTLYLKNELIYDCQE